MDPIHERNISVRTTEIGENMIRLEGTLTDERMCESFQYLKMCQSFQDLKMQLVNAGVYHNIFIRMDISLPKLTIEFISAQMPTVPFENCREIERVVTKLIGFQLARGFSNKVKELMGGVNGCIHMTNLLLAMSASAIQGSYAFYSRIQKNGKPKTPDYDDSLILNSCHVWRESEPFAHQLKKMRKAAGEIKVTPKSDRCYCNKRIKDKSNLKSSQ